MSISRRSFGGLLAGAFLPGGARAQENPPPSLPSAVFDFAKLPVRKNATAEFRAIFKGKTATGEEVEIHHTTVAAGEGPHASHRHKHNEIWVLCEGTAEFSINGAGTRLTPGSAAYASSNDEHGIRNLGKVPAKYFVIALGPGANR